MDDNQAHIEILRDGSRVTIRPLTRQDIELERKFIEALSPQSRRYRFLCSIGTPSDAMLQNLTVLDEKRDAALIALTDDNGQPRQIGVARFSGAADGRAELAVTVSDEWQHKGLGTTLLKSVINMARQRGVKELYSIDAADNESMRELAKHLGFQRKADPDVPTQVIHTLQLQPARAN